MGNVRHIRITVIPDASDMRVEECKDNDQYKVYVTAEAVRGEANKAAVEAIRKELKISGQIRIVSGHRSPQKILAINY